LADSSSNIPAALSPPDLRFIIRFIPENLQALERLITALSFRSDGSATVAAPFESIAQPPHAQ
jgi:hypothetical protein